MKLNLNKNYYQILESNPDDSVDDIKLKYRKLSKEFHPDKNPDNEEKFKEISIAWKVIKTKHLREEYDLKSKFGGNYDERQELYNFEFSNNNVKSNHYRKYYNNFKKELIDILIEIKSDIKILEYNRLKICNSCDGTGFDYTDNLYVFECDACEGKGIIDGHTCHVCLGTGEVSIEDCKKCNGDGYIEKEEKINLEKIEKIEIEDKNGNQIYKIPFGGNISKIDKTKVGSLYLKKR